MKNYKIVLEVKGMYCRECFDHILKCLSHYHEIIKIKSDIKNQKVIITSTKNITKKKLVSKINKGCYGVLALK